MKITKIEVFRIVATLDEPFHWSTGSAHERTAILVRVDTDEGIVGWGEALRLAAGRLVAQALAPALTGLDPLDRGTVRRRMDAALGDAHRSAMMGAVGAVDIALWDIAGQKEGRPLCDLLGGAVRDSVHLYASGLYYVDDDSRARLVTEAGRYVGRGFCGVKMKIGRLPIREDVERIIAVRDALGRDTPLMVDANQRYNADAAVEMGAWLERIGAKWFEEPLASGEPTAYRRLAQRLGVDLAAGENMHGVSDVTPYLADRTLGVLQPNVGSVGGVTELLAVAEVALAHHVPLALHGWGSIVLQAVSVHVAACLPTCAASAERWLREPILELDCTPNPIHRQLSDEALLIRGGAIMVPSGPGLGVALDERTVRQVGVSLNGA